MLKQDEVGVQKVNEVLQKDVEKSALSVVCSK